jgi:hypothetical protein
LTGDGSGTSLNRLLKEMGFVWKRRIDKRHVLIERAEVVAWLSKYLIKMKKWAESEKKNFIWRNSGSTPVSLYRYAGK